MIIKIIAIYTLWYVVCLVGVFLHNLVEKDMENKYIPLMALIVSIALPVLLAVILGIVVALVSFGIWVWNYA